MEVLKKFSFVDKEGKEIKCYKWDANSEAKGIIQISHGMTEYACRYDYFANKLSEQGFIVYAHDHRGHGETAKSEEERGYIADNEGFDILVENVKELTDIIKKENNGLPLILFGHSMGSFVSQRYIELYGDELDGVILSGTNGRPDYITRLGIVISKVEMKIRGREAKSELMDKLSFGSFNNKFKPTRTNYDWLCSVDEEVDKYIDSEYCGFICTTSYYYDLIRGLWKINEKENLNKIPKDLPVYIFAGDKDPVGDFGKGIINLYECYKALGIKDLKYKLYKNGRHEMLNENNKDEVIEDILNWINNII
ncbi:alpha/beta hydrolase [Clostridium celatum]|nr:alpha/beta hydrolase [Clostridium celatum]MCE9654295.1 alpha/beta hydrolase [Clostridium celatum]MDU6297225.1 lysophospholipase [Clostridium celatum]MDY3358982.1 alpha/beta hydrolase [Clostridium celatum]